MSALSSAAAARGPAPTRPLMNDFASPVAYQAALASHEEQMALRRKAQTVERLRRHRRNNAGAADSRAAAEPTASAAAKAAANILAAAAAATANSPDGHNDDGSGDEGITDGSHGGDRRGRFVDRMPRVARASPLPKVYRVLVNAGDAKPWKFEPARDEADLFATQRREQSITSFGALEKAHPINFF